MPAVPDRHLLAYIDALKSMKNNVTATPGVTRKRIPPALTVVLLGGGFMVGAGALVALLSFLTRSDYADQAAGCRAYCEAKGKSGSLEPTYDAARFSGMENKSGAAVCKCR
jgi:hypothetical protein